MIYLDNAATSFPKPDMVCNEVYKCMRYYSGNPGRGAHSLALTAAKKVYECREEAADLFGCTNTQNVIFTLNTTHSINMAVKGILKKNDHVIISDIEHNSVYRPVSKMESKGFITYNIFKTFENGARLSDDKICSGIRALIKPNTKLLICAHHSNICSLELPVKKIAAICKANNIVFAVDAAQSAGHLLVDVEKMGIDILCAPGHKGLLGPLGSGILIVKDGIILDTLTEGGNGINSLEAEMPEESPERYESGTVALPAIAGLCEGIKTVKKKGIEDICQTEKYLYRSAFDRLSAINKIRIYTPGEEGSVLLFNIDGIPPDIVARRLNEKNICVRSGFHCSALGHKTINTGNSGAVRISFGISNTISDIDFLYKELKETVNK